MESKRVSQIMHDKQFKEPSFFNSENTMINFIKGINNLQISEKSFKIIRIVLKFFSFPLLILFRPFYRKIQENKEQYIEQYDKDLITTGSIVKSIIGQKEFPHLQFYLKSGFYEEIMKNSKMQKIPRLQKFMEFIRGLDKRIDQIKINQPQFQKSNIKEIKQNISNYQKNIELTVIQNLCLSAYQQILEEKSIQINKSISKLVTPVQASTKNKNSKITTSNGKEINDPVEASSFLCCRTYFYLNQIIHQPQTKVQQYKKYEFPYSKMLNQILMKTICGFLNVSGGIIYIGIQQNNTTFQRIVVGEKYNEAVKQDILKHFRMLCQRISPQIVNNQLYKLEYVPIKDTNGFIPGKYLIRLKIQKGQKNQLYSFKDYDNQQYFAFRTANQVLVKKLGQQILNTYRLKLINGDDQMTHSNHPGPCRAPDLGKSIYDNSNRDREPYYYNHQSNSYEKGIVVRGNRYGHSDYQSSNNSKPQKTEVSKEIPSKTSGKMTEKNLIIIAESDVVSKLSSFKIIHHKNKRIISFMSVQEEAEIENILNKNQIKSKKASLFLTFEQELFNTINDILTHKKILYAVENRRQIKMSTISELIDALQSLDQLEIPYDFASFTSVIKK